MSTLDRLDTLLARIPDSEHEHVKRLVEYQLTLLALMPEPQRHQEYTRAELALVNFESLRPAP